METEQLQRSLMTLPTNCEPWSETIFRANLFL